MYENKFENVLQQNPAAIIYTAYKASFSAVENPWERQHVDRILCGGEILPCNVTTRTPTLFQLQN